MQLQDLGDRATEGPQQKADHNKKLPAHGLAHLVVLFLAGSAKIQVKKWFNEPLPGFVDSDEKTLPRRYDFALFEGSSD